VNYVGPGLGFVVPVDKPSGPTSHDVVTMLRRALGTSKVGHTGTLDPFASGLLLMCVGYSTRLSEYLVGLDKSYDAVALLGVSTTTEDAEGDVLDESRGWERLTADQVDKVLTSFQGNLEQVPPQFSAKKIKGVPMHRRARRGEFVDLPAQNIKIHQLELLGMDLPMVRFRVRCSSGTYVRSLARDIGAKLKVGAHLVELRRTSVGDFSVEEAVKVDHLSDGSRIERRSIDPLRAVGHLPSVEVSQIDVEKLACGNTIPFEDPVKSKLVVISKAGTLIAIAEAGEGYLQPRKVFVQ
jgi:tRNA pseudouridine55 synthase